MYKKTKTSLRILIKNLKKESLAVLAHRESGAALFLSVAVLAVLLAISLGISTISVKQVESLRRTADSVQAFFAADSGIERALFEEKSLSGTLPNGATYSVELVLPGGGCSAANYCLRSIGAFRDSRRALEIMR